MYRTIDVKMWTDPQFKQLDPTSKLVFVYLITNPHGHVSGIYYLPKVVAAHETGVKPALLDTVYDTLSGLDLATFDAENEVVWVRNMYRHQSRGPKAVAAAQTQLANLHNSSLCHDFCEKYPEVADGVDLPPLDTVSVGYPAQNGLVPIGTGEGEGSGEGSGEGITDEADDEETLFPNPLDTPAFRDTWANWLGYRADTKNTYASPRSIKCALTQLAKLGEQNATDAIEEAIGNGWKGFQVDRHQPGGNGRPGAREDNQPLSGREKNAFTKILDRRGYDPHDTYDPSPAEARGILRKDGFYDDQ